MTNEEKQLLLKDLCARLPYKVTVSIDGYRDGVLKGIEEDRLVVSTEHGINYPIRLCKPYLRPLSSMTEDEMADYGRLKLSSDEFYAFSDYRKTGKGFVNIHTVDRKTGKESYTFQVNGRTMLYEGYVGIDWLNAHHFDYRGLIEMGLAVEAPEDIYKND